LENISPATSFETKGEVENKKGFCFPKLAVNPNLLNLFLKIAFLLILAGTNVSAQTYPKYRTHPLKDTVFATRENTVHKTGTPPAADKFPADFEAMMAKAKKEYQKKKYIEAAKTWTAAFKLCPDNFRYYVLHMRAYCYLAQKEYDKAIQDCTTAIEKVQLPHLNAIGGLMFLRGLAYKSRNQKGDEERACADYKKAREMGFISGDTLFGYEGCK